MKQAEEIPSSLGPSHSLSESYARYLRLYLLIGVLRDIFRLRIHVINALISSAKPEILQISVLIANHSLGRLLTVAA
jgi:hypothetical protein